MYEYKIDNNNKISARSFSAELIIEEGIIQSFRAGSEGAIVGEEKAVEEIEELLASVVEDATGKLVKATMSIVGSSLQDDTFKNDTYYLLGYSDNKKFKDNLREKLIPTPTVGGSKEEVEKSIVSWAEQILQK